MSIESINIQLDYIFLSENGRVCYKFSFLGLKQIGLDNPAVVYFHK